MNERPMIFKAVESNNIAKVKELIETGIDVNQKDKYGYTSLHSACLNGVTVKDKWGDTPLHKALENIEIADYLKSKGGI